MPQSTKYTGFTYDARDWAGEIINEITSAGHSALEIRDAPQPDTGITGYASSGFVQPDKLFPYLRSDGFIADGSNGATDASLSINGIRALDGSTGQWVTPNAFEGRLSDPTSLQRYVFNKNSALEYSDPTGFDPDFFGNGAAFNAAMLTDRSSFTFKKTR